MGLSEKILQLFSANRKRFLLITILLSSLLHAPFFKLPPVGQHVWRQCNTLAVARNFYEEDMNILKPRVDRRGDNNGVTGMQFPSYEYIVAVFYKVFGFHDSISRIVNFLIFCFGIWAVYELFFLLSGSLIAAAFAAWGFCWSPELFYHGINALPDILALSASIAGFAFFLKWRNSSNNMLIPVFVFFLALAGLTKLQFLAVGFPIFVIFIKDITEKKYSAGQLGALIAGGVFAVLIPVLWYLHALQMIAQSGLRDYGISFSPASDWDVAMKILENNILIDIPETILNYAGTLLLFCGVYFFFRERKWKSSLFFPLLVWALALIAYHFIELNQMEFHNYYAMPHIPLLLVAVAFGALFLWQKKYFGILLLLLITQPVLAAVRIIPARWAANKINIPAALYDAESRKALDDAVPDNARCIVGPDKSGCIYFYYLHKKGFGFEKPGDLLSLNRNSVPLIEECISRGVQYLYINDSSTLADPRLLLYLDKTIAVQGDFKVIELKMPE